MAKVIIDNSKDAMRRSYWREVYFSTNGWGSGASFGGYLKSGGGLTLASVKVLRFQIIWALFKVPFERLRKLIHWLARQTVTK